MRRRRAASAWYRHPYIMDVETMATPDMNRAIIPDPEHDMLPEYDFSLGVRGKHRESFMAGANVISLDSDLDENI
jgi:hypothetical protein